MSSRLLRKARRFPLSKRCADSLYSAVTKVSTRQTSRRLSCQLRKRTPNATRKMKAQEISNLLRLDSLGLKPSRRPELLVLDDPAPRSGEDFSTQGSITILYAAPQVHHFFSPRR